MDFGMTPEDIKASQEKLAALEEEEESRKEIEREPFGYRAWDLYFVEGEPRLGSIQGRGPWLPETEYHPDPLTGEDIPIKIVKSDWTGEERDPWETTKHGLYMVKSKEELRRQYPNKPLHGVVEPFGAIKPGSIGFRSQKARVEAVGKWVMTCHICGETAKYYLFDDERYPMCEKHTKLIESRIKKHGFNLEEVESLIRKLAEAYEADIIYEEP